MSDEFLNDERDVTDDRTISVEKEQDRSPLLETFSSPKQAALEVEGQCVVVIK